MRTELHLAVSLFLSGFASAELLVHEPFSYTAGDLTGNNGGTGWSGAWLDSGNPVTITNTGLAFTDAFGNVLQVSGSAVNTADGGAATTISSREVTDRNAETWISVLVQPQGSFTDFIGVSFYQDGTALAQARFAIETSNGGVMGGKDLRLTRRATAAPGQPAPPEHSARFITTIGTTVFAVIHLVPDGGSGGALDRMDVFFNPRLDMEPLSPHASLEIDGLQFDRIRIAAAAGRSALVDEIRIGENFADVAPHTAPGDPDTDLDGLTNSQEAVLGLDPNVSDAARIAAIRANSDWFSLHRDDEIRNMSIGGLTITPIDAQNLEYTFDIRDSSGNSTETVFAPLTTPPDDRFLRLKIETP
jgi:hypothetical protein